MLNRQEEEKEKKEEEERGNKSCLLSDSNALRGGSVWGCVMEDLGEREGLYLETPITLACLYQQDQPGTTRQSTYDSKVRYTLYA